MLRFSRDTHARHVLYVVGRGKKSLLSDPASELGLKREILEGRR